MIQLFYLCFNLFVSKHKFNEMQTIFNEKNCSVNRLRDIKVAGFGDEIRNSQFEKSCRKSNRRS
jgi:hypothetical protein